MTHAFHDIEKAAIVSVQSILNSRENLSVDKIIRLRQAVGNLPPHRALVVYGYSMTSIAVRMTCENHFKQPLLQMGQTITTLLGQDYATMADTDSNFYESQKDLLAENLYKISQLMTTISHNPSSEHDDIQNISMLLDALSELSWRSADQALGKPVDDVTRVPANDLIKNPVSPKRKNEFFNAFPCEDTCYRNEKTFKDEAQCLIDS